MTAKGCRNRWVPLRRALWLPVLLLAGLAAARTAAARDPVRPVPPSLLSGPARTPHGATNRLVLRDAVHHAMQTDVRLNELAIQTHRLAGQAAAIKPASPEIRVTGEQGRTDRRFRSLEMEDSRSVRNSSGRSAETTSQFGRNNGTSHIARGDPFQPDQDQTEQSYGAEQSRANRSVSGTTRSAGSETTATSGDLAEEQEGLSIELRLRLPNPWELRSARGSARAAGTMSEAELVLRERWLACDIAAAAARLHFARRTLAIRQDFLKRAQAGQDHLERAFLDGAMAASDYADACRLFASAVADERRASSRVDELEQDWRRLTGLDPDEVMLEGIEVARLSPLELPSEPSADAAWAEHLVLTHPALLFTQWNMRRCEAEWREARARNIPWPSYLAAGYGWRESRGTGFESFDGSGEEVRDESSSSTEREFEASGRRGSELETPSGDRTTSTQSGRQITSSRASGSESSKEYSTTKGSETSRREDDGSEWWIVVGVDVPVFEWFSREGRLRAQALDAARSASERISSRIHHDLLAALAFTRKSRRAVDQARGHVARSEGGLNSIPDQERALGIRAGLETLRIESSRHELVAVLLDASLQEVLSRTELVRAAGLVPVFEQEHPTAAPAPSAH